ncbi:MAG: SBBP repeat-containing protein [Bryobacteraceae bacterium]
MRVFFCIFLTLSCFAANVGPVGVSRVLAFEARGQEYVSHTPGYSFSVTSRWAVLTIGGRAVRVSASGASDPPSLEALHRMPGKANYILGSEFRSYDLFGSVRWRSVYPGIDLLFRGSQQRLEYDLEIGAGRDPGRIKLTFDGIDHMRIDPKGDLVMVAGAIQIRQPKPVGYQVDAAGQRQLVDVAYWIDASQRVRFRTGAYDRQRPLVIDPEIVFDQSFGGTAQNIATGFTRDAEGGLYVVGTTNSTDFPTVNPFQSQLGTGPLLVTANAGKSWSMPSLGPATSAIAIAAAPSTPSVLYVATQRGVFSSANGGTTFTVTPGAGLTSPANVLAVDAGSSTTVYAGTAQGVFVSTDGAAHWSAANIGFSGANIVAIVAHPTQSGTVFASTGANGLIPNALLRSTDFGQTWTQLIVISPPNQLEAPVLAILFASNGSIILGTPSGLLISTDGGKTFAAGSNQEVFNTEDLVVSTSNPNTLYLVNLLGLQQSSDGGQTFTPLLPSVKFSQFSRVAVDPRNPSTVYAADYNLLYQSTNAGQTWSQVSLPYPISPQLLYVSPADSRVFLGASTQNSAFVTKWSADGSQVLYSTYLGGNGVDQPAAIAVDQSGNAYVTGSTSSPNFPTTAGAFQTKLIGATNAFLAKLNPTGSQLIYSTLLGTEAAMPAAIAVDDSGDAVITGSTQGGFPVTPGAFQSAPVDGCTLGSAYPIVVASTGDAFVTKIAPAGNALVYSTLLGGMCSTSGASLALDAIGNAWVAGYTTSPDFPVTSGALQSKFGGGSYDGYLASFNPSGALDYATYLGGAGFDSVSAIALDQRGNIYLTGQSAGLSQSASSGAFQPQVSAACVQFSIGPAIFAPQVNAFVLKLDPKAQAVEGLTYLGAPGCLAGAYIAVDSAGEPWIAGELDGAAPSEPQTAIPFQIAIGPGFVSKFSADFTQLLFSTYFDSISGIVLDSSGLAYVAGTDAPNVTTGTQLAYVAKIDATPPEVSLNSILSAAQTLDYSASAAIAAGEVLRILGKNIGPATSTPGIVNSGVLATTVAGVQVTFDGVPVPLLSVSAQEIDLVAPFELANKSATTVQVQYNNVPSNSVQVAVNASSVQILGVFNGDFAANSASNPAAPGSEMILYVAGFGQTSPPSQDGQINAAPFASIPMGAEILSAENNPTMLPVYYAGAAPGLAAGIFQINFGAPQQSTTDIDLVLGNGATSTPFSVSIQ